MKYIQINTGDQQKALDIELDKGRVMKIVKVGSFIYLSIQITKDDKAAEEIRERIIKGD